MNNKFEMNKIFIDGDGCAVKEEIKRFSFEIQTNYLYILSNDLNQMANKVNRFKSK